MKKVSTCNYVYAVEKGFIADPEESVRDTIFKQYERVLVESLITSFGLDFLVRDRVGGDVDTIHNVRQIGKNPDMVYKNKANERAYENRGEYSSTEYHSDPRYKEINRKVSEQKKAGTLRDAYTGEKIARNGKTDLDHVKSAKEIHDDPGRVLAGLKGTDLANSEENLKPTNPHTNRTKKAKSMSEFLDQRGDEYTDEQKKRMLEIDANARRSIDAKINIAYYTSPRFAKDLSLAAGTVGLQMGVRQALGFVFAEMWFAVKDEFQFDDGGSFDLGEFLGKLGRGIQRGFENAKRKFPALFEKFLSGTVGGALASLTTTLCNIFFTTAKNAVRLIRQAWASIVEACKVLFINPQSYPFGERMRAAAKILATGASVVVGVLVNEAVSKIVTLPVVGEIVPTFCGAFVSGIMSCTMLTFLDRSELVNKLVASLNNLRTIEDDINYYKEQAAYFERYAAELEKIDLDAFRKETAIYNRIADQIASIQSEEDLNQALKKAYEMCGLSLPWAGYSSFDAAMRDPHMRLVFE